MTSLSSFNKLNKKLSLFFVVSFFTVQMFSFLHMTDHGFEKHEHDNEVCQIYLYCEHTKYAAPDEVARLQLPQDFTSTIIFPELPFIGLKIYKTGLPRAPPRFS